jgi:acetyl-CoA acetyltransferase
MRVTEPRAVALAITSGDSDVTVAGGQELMSLSLQSPTYAPGPKRVIVGSVIKDGPWDPFNGYPWISFRDRGNGVAQW